MASTGAEDDLDHRVDAAELGGAEDRARLLREIESHLSSTNPTNVDRLAHLLGLKARLTSVDRS